LIHDVAVRGIERMNDVGGRIGKLHRQACGHYGPPFPRAILSRPTGRGTTLMITYSAIARSGSHARGPTPRRAHEPTRKRTRGPDLRTFG
jgi:hypothetical protein